MAKPILNQLPPGVTLDPQGRLTGGTLPAGWYVDATGRPVKGAQPGTGNPTPKQDDPGFSYDPAAYNPSAGDFATLRALLNRYGLASLYDVAVTWLTEGWSEAEITNALWDRPEFRTRFRGIFDREAKGLPAISVNEYLGYEAQAHQMFRELGFPPGFYDDPDDFATLIGADVSINELRQRMEGYADAAAVGREEVARQLFTHAGVGGDALDDGDIAAFFIDPDRALPSIRQRLAAASISAAGVGSGFGALSYDEATRLGAAGVTEDQARQTLGALSQQGDVVGRLAGETEGGVDRGTQIGVAAGDAAAMTALERARRRRQGAFEGAGGFATGREGISGLGRA